MLLGGEGSFGRLFDLDHLVRRGLQDKIGDLKRTGRGEVLCEGQEEKKRKCMKGRKRALMGT